MDTLRKPMENLGIKLGSTETNKNKQIEFLQFKSTKSEIKNIFSMLYRILEMTEYRDSELEEIKSILGK